jgi:hypothetical protein
MSFRVFVYWCALCGGWAALAGWVIGRPVLDNNEVGSAGIKGMCLGILIALALGVVDALWVFSLRQVRHVLPRVMMCTTVGAIGGLVGGVVGQLLYNWNNRAALLILGWALTGLMIGIAIGTFDFIRAWVREEDVRDGRQKVLRGALGGTVGGLLGGFLYAQLRTGWAQFFPEKADLWSPSAIGFVALGLCIGLAIAVAQVVLKQAWLRVEAGFRKGREVPLGNAELTIGRAESCDLGLFGDPGIDRLHARILRHGDSYLLVDADSSTGTYVNDARINQPTPLHAGDLIHLGKARVRFRERVKRRT